jgi:hypothetical protein
LNREGIHSSLGEPGRGEFFAIHERVYSVFLLQ